MDTQEHRSPEVPPMPPPLPVSRWAFMSYSEAVLISVAFLISQILLGIVITLVAIIIGLLNGVQIEQNPLIKNPMLLLPFNLLAFIPVLLWGWWRSKESFATLLALRAFPLLIVFTLVPLSIGGNLLMSELDNVLRFLMPLPSIFPFEALAEIPALMIFVLTIVAPLTEEPIFRGIILRGLLRRHSPVASVVVSALLFSFIHLNPTQLLPAFLLGLLVGWIYLKTKSLWPCILVHAIYNGMPTLAMLLPQKIQGYSTPSESVLFQPWWLTLMGAMLFALGMATFYLSTRRKSTPMNTTAAPPMQVE